MTDRKDDYYQPWLRDPAPTPGAAPRPDEGLAKPKEEPPVGIDLSRYPADAPPTTRQPRSGQVKDGASRAWSALRRSAGAFADWTIRAGERADIPARVEAMEIPRRTRKMAAASAAALSRGARAVGRGSAKAGRAAAGASGQAWEKMALGDKVARLSSEAGRGIGEVADKAKAGIGQAAKAGKDGLGEAATKLRPTPGAPPPPPPSGLEQLLAREEAEARASKPAAPDLPLFADTPPPAESAPAFAAVEDDRTPHVPPAPKAATPPRAKAMAAPPPQRIERGMMDDRKARLWLAGIGALAMIGVAFWLGGRFGGGMSRSEVETVVADYIKANPQIIPEALEAQRDREMAKAIDAIRPALEKPYAGAWAGNADGDVTLVVFTDYACGFCRASVPDVDRLIREDKRLKVVFRELPIIAPQSRDAALMALAAARQGRYDAFHHAMFAASSLSPAAISAAAAKAGVVTDGSADATANEALFQRELDNNLAIASQLQLNATPTWVVGDQLLQGQVGYDTLKRAVARARSKA